MLCGIDRMKVYGLSVAVVSRCRNETVLNCFTGVNAKPPHHLIVSIGPMNAESIIRMVSQIASGDTHFKAPVSLHTVFLFVSFTDDMNSSSIPAIVRIDFPLNGCNESMPVPSSKIKLPNPPGAILLSLAMIFV